MTKEHKKLYKAGKNWVVATLTATTITLLGGIGAYTAHADTTAENNQSTETSNISQASQSDNSGNLIVLSQPAPAQSNQTTENNQSVQESQINQGGNQSTSTTPTTETAFAATNSSDGLDPSIYGTVNVRDWDYQKDNNLINLTGYHGTDLQHIIIPNLNDFNNASIDISGTEDVGITSTVLDQILGQLKGPDYTVAISKTSGNYNNKVIATDQDWSGVFGGTGLINVDVSNLDTRNITDMSGLFAQSYMLKTVGDLSQWNTSNVTNMSYLFSFPPFGNYLGNYQLNNVGDLGKWDTRNVTDMSGMFYDNHGGDIGDLSHWDTSNVTDMSYMFSSSSTSASGLTHWNTKNVRDMSDMFDASDLPYKIVASNASAVIPNQVTLKDSTGKILALIDTPTIYNSNKSVKATIDEIVQAEVTKLNKLNHTSYGTPKIISVGDDDYSIANATYVVNTESQSKTGLINYVDQDGKVVKTDQISGKVGDQITINLSLPDGYELANKDEQIPSSITVGEDGIKTITIQVKKLPVVQTGSINYVDQDGKVIKTDTISGKVGDKVDVKISLPDGYELANKDEHIPSVITVTENGIGTINVNIKKINTTNTGWNQQGDDWLYMQKNGYLAKGWNYLNGHWFYFDLQSGIMKTGIQSIGNSFYYLNAQHDGTYGAMKTGWQFVNGHWIGLQGSGNAYVGWQAINGHWYYFDPQTAYALTNWQDINNHWYYFDPINAWAQTGWFKSGAGYWYFFDYANAWADTGWQKINNSWYYFDNVNANALTGWQSINNHWYYFDPTNAWALTGWQWINGHWYWFDQANAWARTGWQYYGGQWYFMDQQNAWMDTGWTTNLANGQLYYLDKNGHPLTGWQRSLNGFWYYLQPGSDAAAIGWNWINGHWYYFNPEETINGIKAKGEMFTGRHFIDNRWNRFDLNGHWLGYEN